MKVEKHSDIAAAAYSDGVVYRPMRRAELEILLDTARRFERERFLAIAEQWPEPMGEAVKGIIALVKGETTL